MIYLPYGRQEIDDTDISAVIAALRSDWLTTGPIVDQFENDFARYTGAKFAISVSSGTAALHAIMHGIGIGPGDEVITTALTFAATANAVLYCGGVPVFADVNPRSLLIDPQSVSEKVTKRTRAIIAMDYAGQPCDYDELRSIARAYKLTLVADACHSLGARYRDRPVGTLGDLNAFSFHPVKSMTTGEGGMVTTDCAATATRIRAFRNHGITTDHRQRAAAQTHSYEMIDLGFNYRLSDLQCALGVSQLKKLPNWLATRASIAERYSELLKDVPGVRPLELYADRDHAYHLYVIFFEEQKKQDLRDHVFAFLRQDGIGCNVHYLPVYLHPYYRDRLGYPTTLCPCAESAYQRILSLPIFPQMESADILRVVGRLRASLNM
jgi:perosamine synthetase